MSHVFARRRRVVPLALVAVGLGVVFGASILGQSGQGSSSQTSPPQQTPVFHAGVNLVTVDAYPVRDGRVVEGLTPDDFDVLEDGKPQKVEAFEFVRVEPTPVAELRDPNTVDESLKLAADPHNRVFVIYLDTHFVRLDGSHNIRQPLVRMLDGILAPNDLFGVMVPRMRAQDMTLARKTETTEAELARFWPWGQRDSIKVQPEGELAIRCYDNPASGSALGSQVSDPTPIMQVPPEILQRSYEDLTLTRMEELIAFLGRVREARSSAVVITDGWVLYGRNESLALQVGNGGSAAPPTIFVGPGGRLGAGGSRDPNIVGGRDPSSCSTEMVRLARIDDQQRMRDLIAAANRSNVTFYAVNPSGLEVWDESPAMMTPTQTSAVSSGAPGGNLAAGLMTNLQSCIDTLLTLTRNTDGIAIVNTNDLTGGLKRIVDENAAYYLLGYYSTNTKLDGTYRRIQVRTKDPKVHMTARRGYTAGTEGDKIARGAGAPPATSAVVDALATLDRVKPDADLVLSGAAGTTELTVVAEVAIRQIELAKWTGGGDLQVVVTDASGQDLPAVRGKIAPGTRGAAVKVPLPAGASGPWVARVTLTGSDGSIDDRTQIQRPAGVVLGAPLIFRGTPSARSALLPVADSRFRRTERVHVEWPVLKALDQREARLLGRDGQPLAVNVTVTEREVDGKPSLAADCVLGPLADGDYVIELTAGAGGQTERQLVPIRVFR